MTMLSVGARPHTTRCHISLNFIHRENVNGDFKQYGLHNGINVSGAKTTQ